MSGVGDDRFSQRGRRQFLVGASASIMVSVTASPSLARRPPVVLFVCAAGTAKSAIARELFRKRAAARGMAATAFSRGLRIEDHVSAPLRRQLDAEAIDTRRDGFAPLAAKDVRSADVVVTFAELPTNYRSAKVRDWSAVPSVNENYPAARADMDRRIETLLDDLAVARPVHAR